ncbi:MAG TPA: SemiSWEET transporter [Chitinophagaceae bacterium]|nr:SemiSWEET transporter [Chitinophagaceae bacterium]
MEPEYIQIVGIGAGILTSVSMLPQIIKTFKEKKAEDLSVVMILILMSGIASWIWYGFLRNDLPIIFTNCFSLLLNCVLLFFRFKYAGKK